MDVRDSLRAVLVLSLTAGASALLVAGSHEFSKERIAANEHERLLATLESVLVPGRHDNDLSQFRITVQDPLLGSDQPSEAFIATRAGIPAAVLLTIIAPDGYNGAIRLLVGIDAAGAVTGVRVLRHRETPGLGDGIEASKSDWILQFTGKTLDNPPAERWTVKQEEGAFDALTGATVTPKAVIKAIKNALIYFNAHRDEWFAAAEANAQSTDEPSAQPAD
jgi:H+/Na+-translocating ferredoxin:NAD+ oxidoreductase subunit G